MFYPNFPSNWSTLRKMMLYKGVFGEPKPEYETVSGPIASFVTKRVAPLRSLLVNIDPVQDLHGYDNPWPAGGGKNLFNYENTGITFANMEQSVSVFSNTNTDSRTFFNFQFRALNNGAIVVTSDAKTISSTGRKSATITISETITHVSIVHNGSQRNLSVTYPFTGQGTFTISFNVTAYNPSSVGGLSFKDVQLELDSTATPYSPYSNICPISGWSAVNVWRTGANIFGGPALKDGLLYSMPTATHDSANKTVSFSSGQAVAYSNITNGVKFKENTRYTFIVTASKNATTSTLNLRIYYTDGTYTNLSGLSATETKQTAVTVSTAGKTVSSLAKFNGGGTTTLYYEESGVFEGDLTAADFYPYSGNQYTIQLGQTVYGGTLDVTNGVLTVDRAMVNLGTLDWTYQVATTSYPYGYFTSLSLNNRKPGNNLVCSQYPVGLVTQDKRIVGNLSSYRIYVTDTSYSDADTFQAAMSGVQLVYELATPITIPLTPQEISTLQGQNALWADSGDVTVEYRSN